MKIEEYKMVTTHFSLPSSDLAVLKTAALLNRRSLSAEIREALIPRLTTLHCEFQADDTPSPGGALAFGPASEPEQDIDDTPRQFYTGVEKATPEEVRESFSKKGRDVNGNVIVRPARPLITG
jgi:hypothetical protein